MAISRRNFVGTGLAAAAHAADFKSNWQNLSQPWLGPDYWANPMQDWRLAGGRLECWVSGAERSVFLLTRAAGPQAGDLTVSVKIGALDKPGRQGYVGVRTGVKGRFSDYRDDAVWGEGLSSGLTADGQLFIGDVQANAPKIDIGAAELRLQLTAKPEGQAFTLQLTVQNGQGQTLAMHSRGGIDKDFVEGGFALVCSAGLDPLLPNRNAPLPPNGQQRRGENRGGNLRFWFRDWTVTGTKVTAHPERAYGPIFFTLHTLSRRVLKLTAQLAPVANPAPAQLQVRRGNGWRTVGTAAVDALARTATFRIGDWDDTRDTPYRVTFANTSYEGTIRRDPSQKPRIVIGALTCCNDFGFPHSDVARNLTHHQPDLLLFTGDQIYERVGGFAIQMDPLPEATLDYLRKWLIWGWGFHHLTRNIPTVCMPDDHDVYHGNIWGAAGKRAKLNDSLTGPARTKSWQDSGGYKMPAEWVNMVQRTQTSHLPDPVDPTPVQQNIGVYYTSMLYGGVSFAIIEDRKWKSAPAPTIPMAKIENGWAQNPAYKPVEDGDAPGAELLGARQIAFLDKWAEDWAGAFIKIAVSQTLWANLCTLPAPANNDDVTPKLPILTADAHPAGEIPVADHDSNGWPQTPRTRALRSLRKAAALHIGGDQHLGSTIQYGIDTWNDGPFALCTPAVSNIWPRRWYPPVDGRNRPQGTPRYCGEFVEGFGNKVTVHAVANPRQTPTFPPTLHSRVPGYGIVELDRATRRITITNWPRHVDASQPGAKPFDGWPVTIHQLDNGLSRSGWRLPALDAAPGTLLQVVAEETKEVVYTIPVPEPNFRPPVFAQGRYTVRLTAAGRTSERTALTAERVTG